MCATHNVTASTQMIMTEEFRKGGKPPIFDASGVFILVVASEVVERVIVGTAEWSELFKKHDFFHKYKYYLMIVASAASLDLQSRWCVPQVRNQIGYWGNLGMQVRHSGVETSATGNEA